jgi:prefoldin subunit 5
MDKQKILSELQAKLLEIIDEVESLSWHTEELDELLEKLQEVNELMEGI